mgnify:CR=1 FL=1
MKQLVGIMGVTIDAVWGLNGSAWSAQKGKGKDTEGKATGGGGFKMTGHLTGDVAPYRVVAVTQPSRAGQGSVRCIS